jgi:hypothetical protein
MHYDDAMEGWYFHTQVAHVNCCVELVRKTSAEDDVVWVVRSTTLKVMYSILEFSWPPKDTGKDILTSASILLPLKPINGESEGYS